MKLTKSLLYLLLLYCVMDRDKLSTTTALLIASVILLFTCYCGGSVCNGGVATPTTSTNPFSVINTL